MKAIIQSTIIILFRLALFAIRQGVHQNHRGMIEYSRFPLMYLAKFRLVFFVILPLLASPYSVAADWVQRGSDIDGESYNDRSGSSVSINADGSVVAIGASGNDGINGPDSGHVRVYRYTSGLWTQLGSDIDRESSDVRAHVAVSISADGSVVAIGHPNNDDNGIKSGHVRIYRFSLGEWKQLGSDTVGEASGDYSGGSVSISSDANAVAIGAHGNDGGGSTSGHVRALRYSFGSWNQSGSDIDGESNDSSGNSVSISADGGVIAIGAMNSAGSLNRAGHVRVHRFSQGEWSQLGSDIDGEASYDYSGGSVSISSDGGVVAIGANSNDGVNGSESPLIIQPNLVMKGQKPAVTSWRAFVDGMQIGSGYASELQAIEVAQELVESQPGNYTLPVIKAMPSYAPIRELV